jgi:hypothetical protein
MSKKLVICMIFVILFVSVGALTCVAQDAQLKVVVTPEQSQVFIDGKPMGQSKSRNTFTMSPGKHTIGVYSYGFKPLIKEINAEPGVNPTIEGALEPVAGQAPGPFGVLQIEDANRAAVLLNGKTPEFFVGHGDMFNNHIWWKQQLLVPPGTHEVTVMKGDQVLFSGPVTAVQNERTILRVGQGTTQMKSWSEGTTIGAQPRFTVGTASATVAIAPVSGELAADPKLIHCNDTVKVAWNSAETLHAYLTAEPGMPEQEVPLAGGQTFEPKVDTKYTFRSVGPGGWVTKSEIVRVNPEVKASLSSSVEPAHYIRVGDKILNQDSAQLTWSTNWADKVIVQPFGTVATNGTQSFQPSPKLEGAKVDEIQTYQLIATNVCGGSDNRIASVHVAGVQEPVLTSVFFPTKFPLAKHLDDGLLVSQQKELLKLVSVFKLYAQHNPDAKLVVMGSADPRDHSKPNMKLSERRVNLVRNYLYVQGIPKDKIEVQALGDEKPLDAETIKQLEAANPSAAGVDSDSRQTRMAYNRRVDVVVMPVGLETAKMYPHTAEDAPILSDLKVPDHLVVEKNQ